MFFKLVNLDIQPSLGFSAIKKNITKNWKGKLCLIRKSQTGLELDTLWLYEALLHDFELLSRLGSDFPS